ncbi:MAG TPA: TOBE domain-containing protein, partial [Methylomirabilota bacterium]|nr:TOBE domain-containing protein [Methylomirabilota bacterium]
FLLPGKVLDFTDQHVNVEVQRISASPLSIERSNFSPRTNGSPVLGQPVMIAIRPEKIEMWGSLPEGRLNVIPAHLKAAQFLGDRYEYTVALGSETRVLVSPTAQPFRAGDKVFLELKCEGITLWPQDG